MWDTILKSGHLTFRMVIFPHSPPSFPAIAHDPRWCRGPQIECTNSYWYPSESVSGLPGQLASLVTTSWLLWSLSLISNPFTILKTHWNIYFLGSVLFFFLSCVLVCCIYYKQMGKIQTNKKKQVTFYEYYFAEGKKPCLSHSSISC